MNGQLESIQGNYSDKMLKVQSTCQDEQFEELYVLLEKNFLQIIFGTWTENCRLSSKLFRMVVKMHSTSPEDDFAESVWILNLKLFIIWAF